MKQSDICLVLEGTYPYVSGGVSSWVHNLVKALSQFKFSLLVILPKKGMYTEPKFQVPPNVVSIHEVYLHDYDLSDKRNGFSRKKAIQAIESFYEDLLNHKYDDMQALYDLIASPETRTISPEELFTSKPIWDMLTKYYNLHMPKNTSFIDYFWAWRYSHLPILKMFDEPIPQSRVYHAISTGYASLVATFAKFKFNSPFLLTEHGIYTNERRIEVEQSEWIHDTINDDMVITDDKSPIKHFWITFFDHLGRMAYQYADSIITLSERNRSMQITNGADPSKCRIIPNGVKLSNYTKIRETQEESPETHVIGFVGRVVPIKDVITLIKACKIVLDAVPNAIVKIMGPTDEDPEYYQECVQLVNILELTEKIEFTGRVDLSEKYAELDVVVLTSISEGQPLVILEANACGVPCIATDVGACAELLSGRVPEDIALGPSGLITPVFNPQATADAIIKIITDQKFNNACLESGIKRVKTYYNENDLNFAYSDIYDSLIKESIKQQKRERYQT